ncbi:MAG TPA: peroxiredoxin [Pseudobdellovibrionaceae bacterium]|nr:peroxiredoxin [Pseudobdellovibrionaceae bacterium]
MSLVQVGKKVPDFKLASSSGEVFQLSKMKGKTVVLYFYPKDSTPGCTIEGQEFNDLLKDFRKKGVEVYGVSRDSIKSHCNFITKQGYKFELLSDEDEKVCQLFDVIKEKNMYGKKVMGIERSTFVIDENQMLKNEFRKIKVEGHAQMILDLF